MTFETREVEEFFVTLGNCWKLPTNATKSFILDITVGFLDATLWNNY